MSTFVLLQCVKMVQSCVVQSCVQCRVCRVIIQHIVRRQSYGMLRLKFVNIDYVGCFFFIAMCPVILQVQGVQCSVECVVQCRVCSVVQSVGSGKYNIYLGAKVYLFEIDKHVVNISQEGSFFLVCNCVCRVQSVENKVYGLWCRVCSVECRVQTQFVTFTKKKNIIYIT